MLKLRQYQYSLVRQNVTDGFVAEADQETSQLFFAQYLFSIPGGGVRVMRTQNLPKNFTEAHLNSIQHDPFHSPVPLLAARVLLSMLCGCSLQMWCVSR